MSMAGQKVKKYCKMKNTLDGINGRLDNVEEKSSELEDLATETIPNEIHKEKKNFLKNGKRSVICGTNSSNLVNM